MMKPTTVDGKPKIANGINFSSLARNAGKFYGTKIIGIENPSPEVSPIKTGSKSPKWLSSAEGKSNFSIEKSLSKFDDKKDAYKQPKTTSNKYEKYCTKIKPKASISEVTKSSIVKENSTAALKFPLENDDKEVCECLEEVTFISRNTGDLPNQTSNRSNPFSVNIQSISLHNTQNENTEFFGSGPNSHFNEGNSINHELESFPFKNETFDIQNINKSSPNKNYLSDIDAKSEEVKEGQAVCSIKSKSELISVHDDYQVLNSQPFCLDLEESRKRFDRLRDFSSKSKDKSLSPVTIKMNIKSSLCNQLESSCPKDKAILKSIENMCSRSSSVDRGCAKSLENLPFLLSPNKSGSKIKTAETRNELSDRISKFYFQKQTTFANGKEAFDLVRKQLYPSFLNDKEADKARTKSVEASESKNSKRIVTPSKTITELFDKYDSSKKPNGMEKSDKKHNKQLTEIIEKEPLKEYWMVMNKDKGRNIQAEQREDMIKKLFDKRSKFLNKHDTQHSLKKNKSGVISFKNSNPKFNLVTLQHRGNELLSSSETNPFEISSLRYKLNEAKQNKALSKSKTLMTSRESKNCSERKSASKSAKSGTKKSCNKSISKQKKKSYIQSQTVSLMDTPETAKTVSEIIHVGLTEAFSQTEAHVTVEMTNIKQSKPKGKKSVSNKENQSSMKRGKSCKISCSHPKYQMWNELDIVERTKAWKVERDKDIESKRIEMVKKEIKNLAISPKVLGTKDYNNVNVIEALCPVIYASRIEKRTQLSLKRQKRKN